jgi:hypothetical protein
MRSSWEIVNKGDNFGRVMSAYLGRTNGSGAYGGYGIGCHAEALLYIVLA